MLLCASPQVENSAPDFAAIMRSLDDSTHFFKTAGVLITVK